jgi:site-specific recombinase XerD
MPALSIMNARARPVLRIVGESDVLADWDLWMRAQSSQPSTRRERCRVIAQASAATGQDSGAFTEAALLLWLAGLPSAGTRLAYYRVLLAWHLWLLRTGRRGDDPTLNLPRPLERRRKKLPASSEGISRLFASGIRRKTRAMVALACYQGLRCCEIAGFDSRRIDFDLGMVEVEGKGGHVEWIPLHPAVAAMAAGFPGAGPWFPSTTRPGRTMLANSVSSTVSKAMERAAVRGTAHALRRWFANTMKDRGADMVTVQELLRHASLGTTQRYLMSSVEAKRAAIHLLPDLTGEATG